MQENEAETDINFENCGPQRVAGSVTRGGIDAHLQIRISEPG
jgi:hypothetical protein